MASNRSRHHLPALNTQNPPPPQTIMHQPPPAPSARNIQSEVVMTQTIERSRDELTGKRVINQYVLGTRLGSGQHGEVYMGFDGSRDYMVVAIKACRRLNLREARLEQLRKKRDEPIPHSPNMPNLLLKPPEPPTNIDYRNVKAISGKLYDHLENQEKKIVREIAIMKKCKHGQIVQLLEVIDDRLSTKIFMVMEFMGGGEVKWRDSNNRPVLKVDQARRICRDVVLGLEYLHHQGIIHRDIKPANLLWTADRKNVKITDFGVSHFSYATRLTNLRKSVQHRSVVTGGTLPPSATTSMSATRSSSKKWRSAKGKETAVDKAEEEAEKQDAKLLSQLVGAPDPILIDESGLSVQAGTPSFLAPEIIWEYRRDVIDEYLRKAKLNASGSGTVIEAGRERESNEKREGDLNDNNDNNDGVEQEQNQATISTVQELQLPSHMFMPSSSTVPATASAVSPPTGVKSSSHPQLTLQQNTSTAAAASSSKLSSDPAITASTSAPVASTPSTILPERPPVTTAIDIWALGVTLYCLLTGTCPWTGNSEYQLFYNVHEQDFDLPTFFGVDRVPVPEDARIRPRVRKHEEGEGEEGGPSGEASAVDDHDGPEVRRAKSRKGKEKQDDSEGAVIARLIEGFLEKNYRKRITLEEVKQLPWITRDIPDPEAWLRETNPFNYDPVSVTPAEVGGAISKVKFHWNPPNLFKRRGAATASTGAMEQEKNQQSASTSKMKGKGKASVGTSTRLDATAVNTGANAKQGPAASRLARTITSATTSTTASVSREALCAPRTSATGFSSPATPSGGESSSAGGMKTGFRFPNWLVGTTLRNSTRTPDPQAWARVREKKRLREEIEGEEKEERAAMTDTDVPGASASGIIGSGSRAGRRKGVKAIGRGRSGEAQGAGSAGVRRNAKDGVQEVDRETAANLKRNESRGRKIANALSGGVVRRIAHKGSTSGSIASTTTADPRNSNHTTGMVSGSIAQRRRLPELLLAQNQSADRGGTSRGVPHPDESGDDQQDSLQANIVQDGLGGFADSDFHTGTPPFTVVGPPLPYSHPYLINTEPPFHDAGLATPRASGGSTSTSALTSPSTTLDYTSDEIFDEDEDARIAARQQEKERRKKEKEKADLEKERQKSGKSKFSMFFLSKSRSGLSDASMGSSDGGQSQSQQLLSPKGNAPSLRLAGGLSGRLERRSADEFGRAANLAAFEKSITGGGEGPASGIGGLGSRTGSGPAYGGGSGAIASEAFTSAMRAASWGEVAQEHHHLLPSLQQLRASLANNQFDPGSPITPGLAGMRSGLEKRTSTRTAGTGKSLGTATNFEFGSDSYDDGEGENTEQDKGSVMNEDAQAADRGQAEEVIDMLMVGAGGILSHTASGPSSPNSLSGASMSASGSLPSDGFWLHPGGGSVDAQVQAGQSHSQVIPPFQLPAPVAERIFRSQGDVPVYPDPGMHHQTSAQAHAHLAVSVAHGQGHGSHLPSPLARTPYNVEEESSASAFDEQYAQPRKSTQQHHHRHHSPPQQRHYPHIELDLDLPSSRYRSSTRSLSDGSEASGSEYGERMHSGRPTVHGEGEDQDDGGGGQDEYSPANSNSDDEDSDERPREIVIRRRRPSESLARSRSVVRAPDES